MSEGAPMTTNIQAPPIFIVGASRSGTAMMRSIVSNHPDIRVSGETHYFDDLRVRMRGKEQAALSDEDRRICEDYFLAIDHRPYGHGGDPEQADMSREQLRAEADRCGEGADAYFEAFCRIASARDGKSRWGDKTPRHIYRIPEILGRYPEAKVICMVRDGRAVVASYRDWRNQGGFDLEKDPGHKRALEEEQKRSRASYDLVIASLLWAASVNGAVAARDRFGEGRVLVQRYEDLVADPEGTIRRIADWLGVAFDPAMLEVPMHNSSFSRFDAKAGVQKDAVDRWREKLSAREIGVIQFCAKRALTGAGYELDRRRAPMWFLAWRLVAAPFAAARALVANRSRTGNPVSYVVRRLGLMLRKSA